MRISDWSSDVCSSDLPGREQLAVAVAAAAVDDSDLDVAPQAIVLQAVVADDDVAAGLDQRARGGGAVGVGAHPGAGAVGDHDRSVTAQRGNGLGLHPARGAGAATGRTT